jgi:hypothetical protein
LDYDVSKGRREICDQLITVSVDQIGKFVQCEKCRQLVEVPFDYERTTQGKGRQLRREEQQAEVQKRAVSQSAIQTRPLQAGATTKKPSRSVGEKRAGTANPRADVMAIDFETEETVSHAGVYGSNRRRCPSCGSMLSDDGQCSLCHYVEKRFSGTEVPLKDMKLKLAGFQLWAAGIVRDGVSIKTLSYIFVGLVCLLYVVIAAGSFLYGGTAGYIVLAIATAFLIVFLLMVVQSLRISRDPTARLGILSLFWNGLLFIARQLNWQGYDARFNGRLIINRRNAPVTDDNIPELEGLAKCQVLDLEKTMITDAGLRHLYSLSNLCCLVVRKTRVTHEGVVRLQQTNRHLWIWY